MEFSSCPFLSYSFSFFYWDNILGQKVIHVHELITYKNKNLAIDNRILKCEKEGFEEITIDGWIPEIQSVVFQLSNEIFLG